MEVAEHRQHVAVVVGVLQADPLRPDAGVGLRGHDDEGVGGQEDEGGRDGGPARDLVPLLGLLVDRHRGVPPPVDEQHEGEADHEALRAGHVERVEPRPRRREVPRRSRPVAHLDQGDDREDQQHGDLDAEQHLLEVGRDLDPDVADGRHGDDPPDADQEHPAAVGVAGDAVGAEELEEVVGGHLGQAGHHQDVGHDDAPAAPPPGLRPEGPGAPGERGAAVGVGAVERLVPVGDEQHGYEGDDRDDRRLQPVDGDDDEAERGRQAVGRGGGRHPHHDRGDEAEGTPLQPLVRPLPLLSQ